MEATYTVDELRNFFEWQLEQVNPMLHRKNKDCWNGATVDSLMASPMAVRGAVETMDRAERRLKLRRDAGLSTDTVAPWEDPLWREKQAAAEKAEAERQAAIAAQQSPFVTGGQ